MTQSGGISASGPPAPRHPPPSTLPSPSATTAALRVARALRPPHPRSVQALRKLSSATAGAASRPASMQAAPASLAEAVAAADARHAEAAALNAAGRFDQAKAAYALYQHALAAADALALADSAGAAATLARLGAAAAVAPALRRAARPPAAQLARARAAVLGAAVADAAAMPLHWVCVACVRPLPILTATCRPPLLPFLTQHSFFFLTTRRRRYDLGELHRLVAGRPEPCFLDPPASAFYAYPTGRASPYGEQAAVLLASMAETRGGFSAPLYALRSFELFSVPPFPSPAAYLDASTRGFLRRCALGHSVPRTGVADAQANAFARLPPLVAALAGDASLPAAVAAMVGVTQAGGAARGAALAAAAVLERIVVSGAAPGEALRAVAAEGLPPAWLAAAAEAAAAAGEEAGGGGGDDEGGVGAGVRALRAAAARAGDGHAPAVAALGRNCHLPGSLAAAAHALLAYGGYAGAVRGVTLQGGCNASRASFVGACFAAWQGEGAIPEGWAAAHAAHGRTAVLADRVLGGNEGGGMA